MKPLSVYPKAIIALLAGATLLLHAAAATAKVEVEFVKPDNYTDAGDRHAAGSEDPKAIMQEFERHFVKLGETCLPAGQDLHIRVLDIRLAGRVEWWHRSLQFQDVRVLRDVTWPEMELEYVLKDAGGAEIGRAKDSLSSPMYLHDTIAQSGLESYPYEKAMMTRWFKERFCPAGAQASAPANAPSAAPPPH